MRSIFKSGMLSSAYCKLTDYDYAFPEDPSNFMNLSHSAANASVASS
jgi:hypothetical protein